MNTTMMIHCGGRKASFEEISAVPLPEETNTYKPVPFQDLIMNTRQIADDLLKDYSFVKDNYALAGGPNKDQRMFGVLQYEADDHDMGYAIGIRSSYDKSITNGFCAGGQVFVCDNLAFSGSVTYMRKHTKNVLEDLKEKMVTTIYNSKDNFKSLLEDRERMSSIEIYDEEAYSFMGRLRGYNVIKPRQLERALQCWKDPAIDDFQPRNLWSLYNACTESLKSTPPDKILEKHIALHKSTMYLA